jgi:SAM-dependent methyltransferase
VGLEESGVNAMQTTSASYPTWIRPKRVTPFWILAATSLVVGLVVGVGWRWGYAVALLALPFGYVATVLTLTSYRLGPRGDAVQRQVHELLVEAVGPQGRLLDVGCGSGELLVRIAHAADPARGAGLLVGVDYWGDDWHYTAGQAAANARLEGITVPSLVRGTASRLPFASGCFARVVSALTFHEVADVEDKTASIREALRVLEPGGRFAFVDVFDDPKIYGGRARVVAVIEESGARVDSVTSLGDVVTLRWPLTLGNALGYGVLVTGVRLSGT